MRRRRASLYESLGRAPCIGYARDSRVARRGSLRRPRLEHKRLPQRRPQPCQVLRSIRKVHRRREVPREVPSCLLTRLPAACDATRPQLELAPGGCLSRARPRLGASSDLSPGRAGHSGPPPPASADGPPTALKCPPWQAVSRRNDVGSGSDKLLWTRVRQLRTLGPCATTFGHFPRSRFFCRLGACRIPRLSADTGPLMRLLPQTDAPIPRRGRRDTRQARWSTQEHVARSPGCTEGVGRPRRLGRVGPWDGPGRVLPATFTALKGRNLSRYVIYECSDAPECETLHSRVDPGVAIAALS